MVFQCVRDDTKINLIISSYIVLRNHIQKLEPNNTSTFHARLLWMSGQLQFRFQTIKRSDQPDYLQLFSSPPASQLRIPRRSICRFQWLFPSIPKQRTQLKPFFPTANRMNRSLVAKINIFSNGKTLGIFVG